MNIGKRQLLALLLAYPAGFARPQGNYPDKPVRIVVPYSPGGSSDVIARAVGEALGRVLGQPVVVENRPGAGSLLGTQVVAAAAADGYTLLLADVPFTIVPALYRERARHDAQRDFAPVGLLGVAPTYLFVHPDFPARTVVDLVQMAAAAPGTIAIGSGGNGSLTHLMAELFQINTGTRLTHVPYKGAAASMADLAAGQIHAGFTTMASAAALYQAGKLRAIAVGSDQRRDDTADVPTFAEQGVSGMVVQSWWGLLAPSGINDVVRDTLAGALREVMQTAAVRRRMAAVGVSVPNDGSAVALQRMIAADLSRWQDVVRRADIHLE